MQRFISVSLSLLAAQACWRVAHALLPQAHSTRFDVEAGKKHLLRLEPRHTIPDSPLWPIEILASSFEANSSEIVNNVTLRLHDLRHPALGDLEILLSHAGHQDVVFNGAMLGRQLRAGEAGTMDFDSFQQLEQGVLQADTHDGTSFQITELLGENLAIGCRAEQKSTGYDGEAIRAVDGNRYPFYSGGSVSHTGGDNENAASKLNPWWQVYLNATSAVNFVRVFNRQVDDTKAEVQRVYTDFSGPLDVYRNSFFKLNVSSHGLSTITGKVLPNAVAMISQETGAVGSGAGPGESLQGILQATGITQNVLVSSKSVNTIGNVDYGSRQWTVTFSGLLGDVPEMTIAQADFNCLSACRAGVQTVVQGGDSKHYIQQEQAAKAAIEIRLYPFLVAVLSNAAAAALSRDASMYELIDAAAWSEVVTQPNPSITSISHERWRQHVLVPVPSVAGDVVRIQLAGEQFLSLAEVQVFGESEDVLAFNQDLERVVPDRQYRTYGPMSQTFRGTPAAGEWSLSIRDFKPLQEHSEPALRPLSVQSGTGSLGLWTAQISTQAGETHNVVPNVFLRIVSLPQYGRLYTGNISFLDLPSTNFINSSTVQGTLIAPAPGRQQFREACTRRSFCTAASRPIGPLRTTDKTGGIVDGRSRLTLLDNAFSVVYEPLSPGWTGLDWFTFATVAGDEESKAATVEVNVHACNDERCDVDFKALSPAEQQLWTEIHLGDNEVQSARKQWQLVDP